MLKPGPMRPEHWNALLDTVKSLRLEAGPGLRAARTSYGTTISASPGTVRAAQAPVVRRPFQLSPSVWPGPGPAPEDQWRRFRVAPGTVNNLLAANHNAEFLAVEGHVLCLQLSLAQADTDPASIYVQGAMLAVVPASTASESPLSGLAFNGQGFPMSARMDLAGLHVDSAAKSLTWDQYVQSSFQVHTSLSASTCSANTYSLVWRTL